MTTADSTDEVRRVMTSPVVELETGATLRTAARVLRHFDVGAAVVRYDRRLVGMLSERDLVQALADGFDPDVACVAVVMTGPPRPIAADMPVWAATTMMLRHHFRHLPIRDALTVSQADRIVQPPSRDAIAG
jgi:CBS domain-containing protein